MRQRISQKTSKKIKAVNNINIDLNQGEVLGFLGPNGAGKSTTMKMLTGFLTPTSGNIMLNGVDMANKPNLAKLELGYLPEGAPAYGEMTPYSYLKFIAEIRKLGKNKVSKVHDTLERINLQRSQTNLSRHFRKVTKEGWGSHKQ